MLRDAALSGIVNFREIIDRLTTETEFRHTRALIDRLLAEFEVEQRRRQSQHDSRLEEERKET